MGQTIPRLLFSSMAVQRGCDCCGKTFANKYQLGPHKRRCWNRTSVLIDDSDFTDSLTESGEEQSESRAQTSSDSATEPEPAPITEINVRSLCRRLTTGCKWGVEEPWAVVSRCNYQACPDREVDFIPVRRTNAQTDTRLFPSTSPYFHI